MGPFPTTGPRDRRRNNDIGVSDYSAELIEALVDATGETPTEQIEWSPFGHSETCCGTAEVAALSSRLVGRSREPSGLTTGL